MLQPPRCACRAVAERRRVEALQRHGDVSLFSLAKLEGNLQNLPSMKTFIQTQQGRKLSALVLATLFAWVGLLPNTEAVSPAPDGGYPGGNTAEGHNALLSLTAGTYNTAVGLFSLMSNQEGQFNTGVGAGTLLANTAHRNTATGAGRTLEQQHRGQEHGEWGIRTF
jgi:hypothetical protein